MSFRITSFALAAGALLGAAGATHASGYAFSQITLPGNLVSPTGDQGQALSINDRGQVLVSALNFNGAPPTDNVDINDVYNIHTHVFTPLAAVPGAVAGSTLANGINDRGQIVGQYDPGVGNSAFGNLNAYSSAGGALTQLFI